MLNRKKIAISVIACASAALALSPPALAKPKKTKFEKIADTTHYAGGVYEAAQLTTRSFNPGPNGKIRIGVTGAVDQNADYGDRAAVSGTLTCSKAEQQLSASTKELTYFTSGFVRTYRTSVTGIKNPKRCTLQLSAWWEPVVPPDVFLNPVSEWPHGSIYMNVFLKK